MTNEKAIEVLTNHRRFIFEDSEEDIAIVMAISALEKQTNTAEWINVEFGMQECSNCEYVKNDIDNEGEPIPYNYCPNCGSRMKGENQ